MTFSTHKQNSPEKKTFCGMQRIHFGYYVHFASQIDFVVKLVKNGRREVKNTLVRKQRMSHVPGKCN